MMIRRFGLLATVLGAFLAVGCGGLPPVYNVENAPIDSTAQQEDIKKAIRQAGASLGWQMKDGGPGLILGTLLVRTHMAKVDIPYNSTTYSIKYKDSSNLKYDGTGIHSRYNAWVDKLDKTIQVYIAAL